MRKFIPIYEPLISCEDEEYLLKAVRSGWVSSLGEFIDEFEKRFADFVGTKYALTVANGTVGLHLALISLGIKEGDEVLVPDLTFVATANAVTYTGAKPVLVDVDLETWCIDPKDIRKKVSNKTKAIIPVHLYGHPAEMDKISEIANEYNLYVIEDAAEAHGAEYKWKKVGSLGMCGVFSFYGNKIITTGEGGMITTDDDYLYEKAKFLRDHSMSKEKRYWHTEVGYNYRMTNIQAALGVSQMEKINYIIEKKRQIFSWYKNFLSDANHVVLNPEKEWAKNVFWMVSIVNERFKDENDRDNFILKLKSHGIDSRPFFYPISELPMYGGVPLNKNAKNLSSKGLNLPSYPMLTEEDVERICKKIKVL